eukprot:2323131-Karenia_brevis.AAC.1
MFTFPHKHHAAQDEVQPTTWWWWMVVEVVAPVVMVAEITQDGPMRTTKRLWPRWRRRRFRSR